jgi:hypothetical protein
METNSFGVTERENSKKNEWRNSFVSYRKEKKNNVVIDYIRKKEVLLLLSSQFSYSPLFLFCFEQIRTCISRKVAYKRAGRKFFYLCTHMYVRTIVNQTKNYRQKGGKKNVFFCIYRRLDRE